MDLDTFMNDEPAQNDEEQEPEIEIPGIGLSENVPESAPMETQSDPGVFGDIDSGAGAIQRNNTGASPEQQGPQDNYRGWDRTTMIRKINDIRLNPRLKAKIASQKIPPKTALFKMSDQELSDLLESFEYEFGITGYSLSGMIDKATPFVYNGYEKLLLRAGLDATGVGEALIKDKELAGTVEELVWKYGKYTSWPAEYRLIISVASTTVNVVASNKAANFAKGLDSAQTRATLEKYPDL